MPGGYKQRPWEQQPGALIPARRRCAHRASLSWQPGVGIFACVLGLSQAELLLQLDGQATIDGESVTGDEGRIV